MPIYEYKCTKCGKEEEVLRSVDNRDQPLTCVKCGEESIRHTAVPAPAQFKGAGWTPKKLERR